MAEKEYIERGALIAEIDRNEPSNWTDTEAEIQSILDYRLYKGIAISQPAADVVEVRHGEWITKGENGLLICSECGTNRPFDVQGDKIEYWQGIFCNICGAKMDGERKVQV